MPVQLYPHQVKVLEETKDFNRVIKQLAEEICNQPKVERMKSLVVPLQIQPRMYLDFKKNRKGVREV